MRNPIRRVGSEVGDSHDRERHLKQDGYTNFRSDDARKHVLPAFCEDVCNVTRAGTHTHNATWGVWVSSNKWLESGNVLRDRTGLSLWDTMTPRDLGGVGMALSATDLE